MSNFDFKLLCASLLVKGSLCGQAVRNLFKILTLGASGVLIGRVLVPCGTLSRHMAQHGVRAGLAAKPPTRVTWDSNLVVLVERAVIVPVEVVDVVECGLAVLHLGCRAAVICEEFGMLLGHSDK